MQHLHGKKIQHWLCIYALIKTQFSTKNFPIDDTHKILYNNHPFDDTNFCLLFGTLNWKRLLRNRLWVPHAVLCAFTLFVRIYFSSLFIWWQNDINNSALQNGGWWWKMLLSIWQWLDVFKYKTNRIDRALNAFPFHIHVCQYAHCIVFVYSICFIFITISKEHQHSEENRTTDNCIVYTFICTLINLLVISCIFSSA